MKKNIEPRNEKYQYHGYQEWYYKNGAPIGYKETNTISMMLDDEFSYKRTSFHIR